MSETESEVNSSAQKQVGDGPIVEQNKILSEDELPEALDLEGVPPTSKEPTAPPKIEQNGILSEDELPKTINDMDPKHY